VLGVGGREGPEPGSVGGGLRAKLSEVKVGAGAVTNVHGLAETLLRVVSVEHDAVKNDAYALENNLDDAAHERPGLHSANQCIVHFLRKQLTSLVVNARPAPYVLVVAIVLGRLKDTGCDSPHDSAENEECYCEKGIVNSYLLGSSVASSPVIPEDKET